MFGPPEGRPSKTQLHKAVVYPRVVSLAFSVRQVHNICKQARQHGTLWADPHADACLAWHRRPSDLCKIAKRTRPGKQKLSPRNPPLRKVTQGKQLPPCHTPHQLFPNLVPKVPDHVPSNSCCACTCLSSDAKCDKAEND
jgi:hypothetical protein